MVKTMIKVYEGKPCDKCGNPFKYQATKTCIFCNRERVRDNYAQKRAEQINTLEHRVSELEEENQALRAAIDDETLAKHILTLEGKLKDCRRQYQAQTDYHLTRMKSLRETCQESQ
jgi:predicted RNase H-like nuclease (RuvC/YqgF family)